MVSAGWVSAGEPPGIISLTLGMVCTGEKLNGVSGAGIRGRP